MRIAFIPRYTRHAASSRLRCYAIAEAIQRQGLAEVQIAEPGCMFTRPFDTIVMQKLSGEQVKHVADVQRTARLIYDLDDAILGYRDEEAICAIARAVTTDTELRAKGIREWFRGPVHVIPDPIDYEDGPPKPPNPDAHDGVVWFGNWPNFESVREVMLEFRRKGFRIGAISDLSIERANMPGLELITWSYDLFPELLRKWSLCVLSHKGADPCKSENKLVAAIYQGVPAAYLCGQAYSALMEKLGTRNLAQAQAYVYEHYRADVIARKAMEVYCG